MDPAAPEETNVGRDVPVEDSDPGVDAPGEYGTGTDLDELRLLVATVDAQISLAMLGGTAPEPASTAAKGGSIIHEDAQHNTDEIPANNATVQPCEGKEAEENGDSHSHGQESPSPEATLVWKRNPVFGQATLSNVLFESPKNAKPDGDPPSAPHSQSQGFRSSRRTSIKAETPLSSMLYRSNQLYQDEIRPVTESLFRPLVSAPPHPS